MRLNEPAYTHARRLVVETHVVLDDRDERSEHRPSAQQESNYIDDHGFADYGAYLDADDEANEGTRSHCKLPYTTVPCGAPRPDRRSRGGVRSTP